MPQSGVSSEQRFRSLLQLEGKEHIVDANALEFVKELGAGSFGTVDLCHISRAHLPKQLSNVAIQEAKSMSFRGDPPGSCAVASKRFHRNVMEDPTLCHLVCNEVEVMLVVSHPYIVRAYGMGCVYGMGSDGTGSDINDITDIKAAMESFYLVLEYVPGTHLRKLVISSMININDVVYRRRNALKWLLQLATALNYLHSQTPKIMHRDIKLENIILTGSDTRTADIRLADLGLAVKLGGGCAIQEATTGPQIVPKRSMFENTWSTHLKRVDSGKSQYGGAPSPTHDPSPNRQYHSSKSNAGDGQDNTAHGASAGHSTHVPLHVSGALKQDHLPTMPEGHSITINEEWAKNNTNNTNTNAPTLPPVLTSHKLPLSTLPPALSPRHTLTVSSVDVTDTSNNMSQDHAAAQVTLAPRPAPNASPFASAIHQHPSMALSEAPSAPAPAPVSFTLPGKVASTPGADLGQNGGPLGPNGGLVVGGAPEDPRHSPVLMVGSRASQEGSSQVPLPNVPNGTTTAATTTTTTTTKNRLSSTGRTTLDSGRSSANTLLGGAVRGARPSYATHVRSAGVSMSGAHNEASIHAAIKARMTYVSVAESSVDHNFTSDSGYAGMTPDDTMHSRGLGLYSRVHFQGEDHTHDFSDPRPALMNSQDVSGYTGQHMVVTANYSQATTTGGGGASAPLSREQHSVLQDQDQEQQKPSTPTAASPRRGGLASTSKAESKESKEDAGGTSKASRGASVKFSDHNKTLDRTLDRTPADRTLDRTVDRTLDRNTAGSSVHRALTTALSKLTPRISMSGMGRMSRHSASGRDHKGSMSGHRPFAPQDQLYDLTKATGSLMYMAPEVYRGLPYNEKADVFSFAMCMYELLHFQLLLSTVLSALPQGKDPEEATREYAAAVAAGYRPPVDERLPAPLANLLQSCWAANPVERPSMAQVQALLQTSMVADVEALDVMDQSLGCGTCCTIS